MTSPRPDAALTRRTVLRRAAASAALLAVPTVLSACGDAPGPGPEERSVTARSIGVDIASYYAPVAALHRLIGTQADRENALITYSDDAAGVTAQQAILKRWLDPEKGFDAVVVSPFDAAALRDQVRTAVDAGVHVVAFVAPLPGASARITVDPADAGKRLVRHLAAWAGRAGAGRGEVVLVRPGAGAAVPDPLAPLAAPTLTAITAELARVAPGLRIVATVPALAAADAATAVDAALDEHPDARIVLGWNDTTALGGATALRDRVPSRQRGASYAGGVALGGPTSLSTLDALSDRSILRCVVAASLRELARAAVALPLSLLRDGGVSNVHALPIALTPGSDALRRARADLRSA